MLLFQPCVRPVVLLVQPGGWTVVWLFVPQLLCVWPVVLLLKPGGEKLAPGVRPRPPASAEAASDKSKPALATIAIYVFPITFSIFFVGTTDRVIRN
jgi:hypothetical protein